MFYFNICVAPRYISQYFILTFVALICLQLVPIPRAVEGVRNVLCACWPRQAPVRYAHVHGMRVCLCALYLCAYVLVLVCVCACVLALAGLVKLLSDMLMFMVFACVCMLVRACVRVCVCACVRVCVCVHARDCACNACHCACVHVCMCACVWLCMCLCACVRVIVHGLSVRVYMCFFICCLFVLTSTVRVPCYCESWFRSFRAPASRFMSALCSHLHYW